MRSWVRPACGSPGPRAARWPPGRPAAGPAVPATLQRKVMAMAQAAPPPRVDISEDRLSELLGAELTLLSNQVLTPLSLRQVLDANTPHKAAELMRRELPKRFAHRIRQIEEWPGWQDVPELEKLHELYFSSFRELSLAEPGGGGGGLGPFTEAVQRHKRRMQRVLPMLMEAMHELQEDGCGLSHTKVDSWLNRFLLARIGTEMLSTQFLGLGSPTSHGIAYRACCPARIIERAAMRVRSLCAQEFPWLRDEDVKINVESVRHDPDGPGHTHITYVPQYLFYIVVELLKNSARATVITARDSQRPFERRPITVSVCADDKSLVIRVEDRAGGIPAKSLDKVWSYLYTTAPARSDSWEHQGTPLAGFGVGLPLSRLYARYLGGNLRLISMPGQGTLAYVNLLRLEEEAFEGVESWSSTNSLHEHQDSCDALEL